MKNQNYDKTKSLDFQQTNVYLWEQRKALRDRIDSLEKENLILKRMNYCMLFLISITLACLIGVLGVMIVT